MNYKVKIAKIGLLTILILIVGFAAGYGINKIGKRQAPPVPNRRTPTPGPTQLVATAKTSYDWTLTPAGLQIQLGDFPLGAVLSPDQHYLVVSNDGEGTQSLQVVDLQQKKVIQTIPYPGPEALYLGVAFSPDGKHLYASAGGNNVIRVYNFSAGRLVALYPIRVGLVRQNEYPAGLSVAKDGKTLYVADNLADAVSKIDLTTRKVVTTTQVGHMPYTAFLSHDDRKLYVSNWGESSVSVLNPKTMKVIKTITVGLHPNAMAESPDGKLYVTDADSDQISVIDPHSETVTQTISLLPPSGLTGTEPDSLAFSNDGKTLYVTNAGNNDVAVINTTTGQVQGLIPTAWYPTGVYYLAQRDQFLVMNAKGMGSGPNTGGQYIGNMIKGTIDFIDQPDSTQLASYTQQVAKNNKPDQKLQVIPQFTTNQSPIKHVIYVIKENRTYDQVFGDIKKGNGDPNLVMFGKDITPNLHKLANQFELLDNFYADAEVSAQGHNWATAAKSNDYVEKNWPANYSFRNRPFDFEGGEEATYSQGGFLWDDARRSQVSFRDYGEFYVFGENLPTDPAIGDHYDPNYVGWNLQYSDLDRIKEWATEYKQFEANNNLPQFEIVYLPNDHTAGTRPGGLTPQAMVAQNDEAVGQLVDTVSHSKDWADTAIFITEDDAQSGLDHVDAHRTESLVISPYTQTGKVDNTYYDTASMLRTMEMILGLKPMSQYDAAATPMLNAFTDKPNLTAYSVLKPTYPLDRKNGLKAPMARQSMELDFKDADEADPNTLNHILWQATKGNQPYPNLKNRIS